MDNNENRENGSTIRELFYVLKRNIILLIVIVLLVTVGGVVYANVQKPSHTATEMVFFKAQNIEDNKTTNNINVMRAYVDTVADFCDEGVVLDRANYYYKCYEESKKTNATSGVDDYILSLKNEDTYDGQIVQDRYIFEDKISVQTHEPDENGHRPFSFSVSYTDDTEYHAWSKVKILIFAFGQECLETEEEDANERKYFDGVNVEIIDEGLRGTSTNVPKTKITLLFFALGIVAALIIVYVKNILDNTVKTKEELEQITGLDVMAVIYSQGGDK